MLIQKLRKLGQLGGGSAFDALLLAISLKCGPPLGRPAALDDEALPAIGSAERNAARESKCSVLLAIFAIEPLLFGSEIDINPQCAVFGQELAGQLRDFAAVHDVAEQCGQQHFLAIGSLRRGSEAEAERCQAAGRDQLIARPRQMMT